MSMNWKQLLNADRPRKSTVVGDHRMDFERDFDRAIFSTPVKRLQDKAQVFPLEPIDAIRTRLTHSLEVSSVARGLGIAVGRWLIEQKLIEQGMDRGIEAITATCGLIHDLGNPPFGHSGEDAIRSWFIAQYPGGALKVALGGSEQCAQDFLKFEGNAQTLRLVSKLQLLADFNGLNLTFATLSASCKYIAASHDSGSSGDHAKSKPGYFASENALVAQIRERTGTGDARHPLTYLVEAADDIVYSVADIEDAVKKGVLKWRDAEDWMRKAGGTFETAIHEQQNILKAGGSTIASDLPDDAHASAFRTAAIRIVVSAVTDTFKKRYGEIIDGRYTGELVKDCQAADLVKSLKTLGGQRVYCTPSNLKLELMGRKIITDLLTVFWEGAKDLPLEAAPSPKTFPGKIGALLSDNYRRVFQHFAKGPTVLSETYHRLQLVTDYVCGMTDSFAKRLHAELMNG